MKTVISTDQAPAAIGPYSQAVSSGGLLITSGQLPIDPSTGLDVYKRQVLTFTTVAPIIAIVQDTFKIHPGTIDAHLTGQAEGYTLVNYIDLFTSKLAKTNLWNPLLNTVWLAVGTCIVSILFGGVMAFLVTRTDLAWKKYLSSICLLYTSFTAASQCPHIMPSISISFFIVLPFPPSPAIK